MFTLCFWVNGSENRTDAVSRLLAQEATDTQWIFQSDGGAYQCFIGGDNLTEVGSSNRVTLRYVWRHVAISRERNGTSTIWLDGTRALEGREPHPWPTQARWLVVGNGLRGGHVFEGKIRDLCAFERVLTDEDVRALYATGLPKRPAQNTSARLAATLQFVASSASTNVVTVSRGHWIHDRFTTEDGLPGNIVKAVVQSRDGYLWVGTEEGLARFDGRRFTRFTSDNTAALKAVGHNVSSLAEDSDGTLWAGVFGGLIRVRGTAVTAFTNGLAQRYVLHAYPVGDGSVWVAGFNNFVPRGPCWLRRYHPDSQTTSAEVVVPGHLRRLVMTTNGVWLAAEQPAMIHFWDGQNSTTTVVGLVDDLAPTIRLGNTVLPVNTAVGAWAGSGDRASTWAEVRLGDDAGAPTFYWLWHPSRPWTARWSGPAALDGPWLGVLNDLARVREDRLEKIEIPGYPANPEISCLAANREGGVWFGTEEDGLHLLRERLIQVYTTEDGLSANDVRSVCVAPDGGIWAATSAGLTGWREGQWTSHLIGGLRSVTLDSDGHAWFGAAIWGDGALQRLASRREFVSLGLDWQDPNTLRLASDGKLWVVGERGVTWVDPGKLVRIVEDVWGPDRASTEPVFGRYAVGKELPDAWPLGLVEERDGSIWFGSLGHGLFRVSQGQVEAYSTKDGLPGNRCVPVYLDDSGALWMVTDSGLTRRRNGQFETVTPSAGLPQDVFLDMIEDDGGNFWISGKQGIHRVQRGDLEGLLDGRLSRVENLTLGLRDGLLTPECSSLHYPTMAKTPDGHIWVATRNGLARFDPRRVSLDTKPLPAVIERLIVNRREFPHANRSQADPAAARDGGLRLPPGSGQQLEFHYTAISLVDADRLSFRHRLDGYDTEWSPETDLRLAFYTNLRPGDYRFEVTAANAHGIWSSVPASLEFEILPFFWQTTFFRLSSVTALALAALGLHGHRLRTLRRLHSVRQEQALAAEKERIAADMHDELGAALTQITILGEVAKDQPTLSPQTRSTLDRISGAARDVTARMSELVWATNPRNDKLDNLVAYLREHAAAQLEDTPVVPHLEFPATVPDHRVSASFRRNLLLVVKEALNNVVKHSQASKASRVHVQLQLADGRLHLRIEDNGRGLAGPRRPGGNGLGNMERRIRDLGGEFTLESQPEKGVRIRCTLPLK